MMEARLSSFSNAQSWAHKPWPEHQEAGLSHKNVVVIPTASLTDWKLGFGMDLEELVLMKLLKRVCESMPEFPLSVLPPVRFVSGAHPGSAFALDLKASYAMLESICESVHRSGYHRIIFYNLNPWVEDIIDVVGREMRVKHNLECFCVNLRGIGIHLDKPDEQVASLLDYCDAESLDNSAFDSFCTELSHVLCEVIKKVPASSFEQGLES